jgi:hypothetical protein
VAEYQGNFAVPANQRYNSTANGNSQYPVVVDPVDQEMGQAFLAYSFEKHGDIKLGLQRVNVSNQRFVGAVGWRQLEQVFTAASYKAGLTEKLSLHYAYLTRVVRIFGEHNPNDPLKPQDLDSHALDLSYEFKPGTLHAYAFLFENKDLPLTSNKNFGVRFDGGIDLSEKLRLLYTGEYAQQSSYDDGASIIDADYGLVRAGVKVAGVTARVGYEMLGGDGTYAFQTPYATLHKFNGWADRFLVTPADGLKDLYVDVSGSVSGVKLLARYHNYGRDAGSTDYGTEWNLLAGKTFKKIYGVYGKYAMYSSEASQAGATPLTPPVDRDVDKFWIWLELKL